MICNASNIKDAALLVVLILQDAKRFFYPCGSRYFGYFTSESDYDFFFQRDDITCQFLADNQFLVAPMPIQYMDVNTYSIWTRGNVHCMEVISAQNRIAVQDWILAKRFAADNPVPTFRPPKGDKNWWNERYCEMWPDQYTMPEELTSEEKQACRNELRGLKP